MSKSVYSVGTGNEEEIIITANVPYVIFANQQFDINLHMDGNKDLRIEMEYNKDMQLLPNGEIGRVFDLGCFCEPNRNFSFKTVNEDKGYVQLNINVFDPETYEVYFREDYNIKIIEPIGYGDHK